MSGFDFDAPEDVAGEANYLTEAGTYHFVITQVYEGQTSNGNPIDGFQVEMDALGGTVPNVIGKSHSETLFKPKLTDKDGAILAARRRLAAFFIAADLMRPDQLGKAATIDLSLLPGRQVVMRLTHRMDKDETTGKYTKPSKYLQIDYAAAFHVDDPEVKDIPKNVEALQMIEAPFRHKPEYFGFKEKVKAPKPKQAAVAAASYDDI